ncbi:MAG TPA: hypothetical protein VG448_07850 [Solirubrobacterales bacterium]|nr:hypothetical protein [Solirubrobacterales bacterium]
MKFTKILGVVAVAALALMAFASTASATTLETKGVAVNSAETIEATLASGASALLTDTNNVSANTCTSSTVKGTTAKDSSGDFTGPVVEGPISTLTWSNCTQGNPTAELNGTLSVENISGTTNGTVRSNGAKVKVPSFFGTLTCTTSNTDIGKLNGVKEGNATFTINAVLTCTVIGSAKWSGTYTITTANLGVSA